MIGKDQKRLSISKSKDKKVNNVQINIINKEMVINQ